LRTIVGHTSEIYSLAFRADGKVLASSSDDGTVRIWDTESWNRLWVLAGHSEAVPSVSFCGETAFLASGSHDRRVKLWDTESGKETALSAEIGSIASFAFHPDGNIVAAGYVDSSVRVGELISPAQWQILRGHGSSVDSLAFSK
jgi:WD40 repeat protein